MERMTTHQEELSAKDETAKSSQPNDAKEMEAPTGAEEKDQAPAQAPEPAPGTMEHFKGVVERANAGSPAALGLLRHYIDINLLDCQQVGDLCALAEKHWLNHLAGNNEFLKETVKHKLATMKSELKGSQPTQPESMMADLLAVTWLAVYDAEIAVASFESHKLVVANFALRRVESAQKRHLQAIKALETLRTLTARRPVPIDAVKLFKPKEESA